MRKFRIGLIVACAAIIIVLLFTMNYNDLSWKVNKASYVSILSMMCLIVALILSNKQERITQ